jgi:predicted ArsR family transcriptional regulator
MNYLTKYEKQRFRDYFTGATMARGPLTVAEMAKELGISLGAVRRRLTALGRNVVKTVAPVEGVQGRPARRFEARR